MRIVAIVFVIALCGIAIFVLKNPPLSADDVRRAEQRKKVEDEIGCAKAATELEIRQTKRPLSRAGMERIYAVHLRACRE